jgi:hypothetical protein
MVRLSRTDGTPEGWSWMTVSCVLACTPMASPDDTSGAGPAATGAGAPAPVQAGDPSERTPAIGDPLPSYSDPGTTLPSVGSGGASGGADVAVPGLDAGSGLPAAPEDAGLPGPPPPPSPRVCIGSALRLDGASFAQLSNPLQDDLTLEAWIKTTTSLNGAQFYQGRGVIDADVIGGGNADDFAATILNGSFAFGIGNPDITLQASSRVIDDEWVHVAATRRAATGQMTIVVNGELEASGTSPNRNPLIDPETIAIGGGSLVRNFVGLVDEVRLWNVVRTPEAIRANLREITSPDEAGLVGYYRFEDGGIAAAHDSSLRGSDAALFGAPSYEPSTALCPPPSAEE